MVVKPEHRRGYPFRNGLFAGESDTCVAEPIAAAICRNSEWLIVALRKSSGTMS
jgi:hypothetical protein